MKNLLYIFSKAFFAAILLFNGSSLYAQTYELEGRVIDKATSAPLPFAHIRISNDPKNVSTSNLDGYFSISFKNGDSLKVSFIGYEESITILQPQLNEITIELKAASFEIPTIYVEEESDLMYILVSRTKKTKAPYTEKAKTYFFQESKVSGQQTEMIETYYNASYKGYDLERLDFKNGRIGLRPIDDYFLTNQQTSKAIMMHQLVYKNEYFPESPIGMSKGKIKKHFELKYENRYLDENGNIIYQISFLPKKKAGQYFKGSIWLDSNSAKIQRIELVAEDCKIHPFRSLFPDGEIKRLDLDIRKSFTDINGWSYPRQFDFSYKIDFKSSPGDEFSISSSSLLYAFDYEDEFFIPKFDFPLELDNDYRKVNAIPRNEFFWNNKPFKLSDHDQNIAKFFGSNSTMRARNVVVNGFNSNKAFFEHPYIIWNGNRIRMRDMPGDSSQAEIAVLSDLYDLEVQLYLDVNAFADSVNKTTAAIFDPFKSYYHLEHNTSSTVFLNIYFDLAEIYNRKLFLSIKDLKDIAAIEKIYEEINSEFENQSADFFAEVRRGDDLEALRSWNEYIRSELGIDNFEIFRLNDKELKEDTY